MQNYNGMKKALLLILLIFSFSVMAFNQTMTELVVPKYIGSKSAASANNCRTTFSVCLQIDGLIPNTSYDIKAGVGLVSDAATSFGAGNVWTGAGFTGIGTITNIFTTDGTGSSGPFWVHIQPTGNGTRFDAGQVHTVRIGCAKNGTTMPFSPSFVTTKTITALDIPVSARTATTDDDGAFVKGSAMPSVTGKYVLLFDNVAGTGDPLFSYMIRQMIPTQVANNELPALINDTYMQAGTSAIGDYLGIIPIGANNPNGVRRIEARNDDNTLFGFNTDSDGIWPSGGNTTTPARRDVVIITNTDAPLVPTAMPPTVITTPVTNINANSATGGGNVTNDGGSGILARGLCWATTHNPTLSNSFSTETGDTGPYNSVMTGLSANTQYYVKAYATNAIGTSYGNEIGFITLCVPLPPVPNFFASKTSLVIGEAINFYDSTIYCPSTWSWSFVGGIPATSTSQNPAQIRYNFPGVYNVCLTVTNSYGQQTLCKAGYITVSPPLDAKVVISEIMYNPPESGTDSLEYIELYNNDTAAIDMQNFYFADGVDFTFPPFVFGTHSYAVVAKNALAMLHSFGVTTFQWNSGSLTNSGEVIRLKDRLGATVDSVRFTGLLPWDTLANGKGPSLELCDPNVDNTVPANWRHAIEFQLKNGQGDSIWGSPGMGCSYPPVANFYADDTLLTVGQYAHYVNFSANNPTTWTWNFQGGTPSTYTGQNPPLIQYNTMGRFDVTLYVANNSGHNTKMKQEYIEVGSTGIRNVDPNQVFSIYPNPGDGKFTITLKRNSVFEVKTISLLGTTMDQRTVAQNKFELDLTAIQSGIYFIQVTDKTTGEYMTQKVIIK